MFRCNCLVWALLQWYRHGGYLAMRRSHYGPVPHFIWSQDLRRWHGFTPLKPKYGYWAVLFMWWFKGAVIEEKYKLD